MMDLISIVVAVYNAESTLKKCVDSLLGQTYKNIEIILVNDCSKDNSLEICRNYAKINSNIVVVDNPINMKVSATRNNGIKVSTGKYICFIDSDDYIEQTYIQKLYDLQQEYKMMPICGFMYHDEVAKKNPVKYVYSGGSGVVSLGEAFRLYDELYLTALWNKLFDNNKIKENNILFDENLSIGEDLKFTLEYLKVDNSATVFVLAEPLYHYLKLNENSLISQSGIANLKTAKNNLKSIKMLAYNYNSSVQTEYINHIEKLENNFIYNISRNNKLTDKEKITQIQKFRPQFNKRDLLKQKIIMFKEKVYYFLFRR